MIPWARWTMHGANLGVSVTGLVYFAMRFLMTPVDEWAVVNHPWQPTMQHAHVLLAPLLVFAFGLLFQVHLLARLRAGPPGKISGLLLAGAFATMALSGYALQVSTGELTRAFFSWAHLGSSGLWLLFTAAHLIAARRHRRRHAALAARLMGSITDPVRSA